MAHVLLVDDDPNILDTAKDILEDAGYDVLTAATAAAAIETITAQPCDVVIVDLNLPDGTGLELAPKVTALCPKAKVILMTGEASLDLSHTGGAITDYLVKPVNPQKLLALLLRYVNSH